MTFDFKREYKEFYLPPKKQDYNSNGKLKVVIIGSPGAGKSTFA